MQEGEAACLKRFGVKAIKESEEKDLQAWIEADPARKARWDSLMSDLKKMYDETEAVERNKAYFRETFFRGTIIGRTIMRMNSARGKFMPMKKFLMRGVSETDQRVERDLLEYSV